MRLDIVILRTPYSFSDTFSASRSYDPDQYKKDVQSQQNILKDSVMGMLTGHESSVNNSGQTFEWWTVIVYDVDQRL